MSQRSCAYCGTTTQKLEKEHVIPKCLYPSSKATSKVQRITVPTCSDCNRGWSDDEPYFRDVMLVSGEPNLVVQELWDTKARSSFDKVDGKRRLRDVYDAMKPVNFEGHSRRATFPGNDPRVVRIVKKIVRGLSFYHKLPVPVSESQVWTDVLKYPILEEYLRQLEFHHREKDIFTYGFTSSNEPGIESIWLLLFFERCFFIAFVEPPPDGP